MNDDEFQHMIDTFFATGGKVTSLPPGEAVGYNDMQTWSHRRSKGRSGVPEKRKKHDKDSTDIFIQG